VLVELLVFELKVGQDIAAGLVMLVITRDAASRSRKWSKGVLVKN
jgi:hypothetical protein